jgi:germination protein YpeB
MISALTAAAVALGAFAFSLSQKLVFAERVNQIYGERALNTLTESLSAMDEALQKSQYATSAPLLSRLYTDAATDSASAVTALCALPYSTYELEKTSQYLNGMGDYVLYLSRAASEGNLTDEAAAGNIAEMMRTLETAAAQFSEVRQALADHAIIMDGYGACADDGGADTVGCELARIEAAMPEYPELIYDGQFSAPASDGGDQTGLSEQQAKRAAAVFLGVPEQRLTLAGKSGGELPRMYFSLSTRAGEDQQIAVATRSGEIAAWSNSHRPESGRVTEDEAAAAAAEFLAAHGFGNLTELSRRTEGGICEVSYACSENGVLCLDAVITVSVARDNGEVCAMIADKYLENRVPAKLIPVVSAEAAAKAVPDSLTPVSTRLVLTRTAGTDEFLCYQISCKNAEGETVILFVDADTGEQKMIELVKP